MRNPLIGLIGATALAAGLVVAAPTVPLGPVGSLAAPTPAAADGTPAIAFTSQRDGGGLNQIYVMGADGSSPTRLSDGAGHDTEPAWSPDGTRIAFVSSRDGNSELYVMDADGSDVTRLTTTTESEGNPDWSPDGTRIVFDRLLASTNYEIFTMDAGGGDETRLTNVSDATDADPAWSPDGTKIAFQSNRSPHAGDLEIYVMDADGTDQTRVTSSFDSDTDPAWSPAGNQIVFRSRRTGAHRIYTMGATGTSPDPTAITDGNNDAEPSWAPDDSYIAFRRSDDGDAEIWLVSREGEFTKLTDNTTDDWQPDWRTATETELTDVGDVATGAEFSCALLGSGQVRCWGYGALGQLGNGGTADSPVPVVVSNAGGTGPLTGATQLTSGTNHSCVLVSGGQVRCWGDNDQGQLGDGTTTPRSRPVTVTNDAGTGPLTGVAAVSAGEQHTCALKSNGQVRCWGDNSTGQLGDGTTTDRLRPVTVSNPNGTGALTDMTQVSAGGFFSCAEKSNSQLRCWGSNFFGQLGDGTTTNRTRPVSVSNTTGANNLQNVKKVSAGRWHACVVLDNGQARCWGDNEDGQLGDGTTTDRTRPVSVSNATGGNALQNVGRISAGAWHTCARLTSGQARCWGSNTFGALGDGTTTNRTRPVTVTNSGGTAALTAATVVSAGEYRHSCALVDGDRAACWGYNSSGQLGDGTTTNRTRPVSVLAG